MTFSTENVPLPYECIKMNLVLNYLFESPSGISLTCLKEMGGADTLSIAKSLESLGMIRVAGDLAFLNRSSDDIFPDRFTELAGRYHYYPEVTSTMDVASYLASQDCPDFTVVCSESQISGRGRLGREWISDVGGIYLSIVLRPAIAPELFHRVNFMVSAVITGILRKKYGIDALVKWPNDILAGGGKLSGMLSESVIQDGYVKYVIVGIGINVNNTLTYAGQPVSSMAGILGCRVSRRDFLRDILRALEDAWEAFGSKDWIKETRKHSATLGRTVRIESLSESLSGLAVDVDDCGRLVLVLADGSRKIISFGDCVHAAL